MKRSTRLLLGISIALVTAVSLHLTVGERFHRKNFGHNGRFNCGHDEGNPGRTETKRPSSHLGSPPESTNINL
jgi:hypothetical protein